MQTTKHFQHLISAEIGTLTAHQVITLSYDCAPRGLAEDGTIDVFWTGEIDMWGKLTFQSIGATARDHQRHYLFPEEIVSIAPYGD